MRGSGVFELLAFLDLLSRGSPPAGVYPTPAPLQPSQVPQAPPQAPPLSAVPPPAPHPIPPPGDIGPPLVLPDLPVIPPGYMPSPPPPDLPPPPEPAVFVPPMLDIPPVPTAPPVPPGALPPMPPWGGTDPVVPSTLPPFPGPGWVPDTPVTDTIAQRASYWNPQLWNYATKTIVKPYVQEMLGGQWVTFAAAWHPGDQGAHTYMATEAWRLASAPPVAPPSPVVPAHMPPPGDSSPLQTAALRMADVLDARGYRQSDQPTYKAFQSAAKLGADGYPGTGTMAKLASVLATAQRAMPHVPIYPWKSAPGTTGYDGHNAPTWAQWNATGAGVPA